MNLKLDNVLYNIQKLCVNFLQEESHVWHIKMDLAVILYCKWKTHKV